MNKELKKKDVIANLIDSNLTVGQISYLIKQLELQEAYIPTQSEAVLIYDHIVNLVHQTYPNEWSTRIENALETVLLGNAKDYWARKLEHLKGYLIDPNEPKHDKSQKLLDVRELREKLEESDQWGDFKEPQLIRVTGTLFPAALLDAGWWERVKNKEHSQIHWRDEIGRGNSLQQWLFEGFDMWAPSWDVSWDFEGREEEPKQYYIAQLADGDEANSLPVIIPYKLAMEWREKFKKGWGGLQVEITGMLGYISQARENLPEVKEDIKGEKKDYCIWLKDDDERCKIHKCGETELYSGYLWQCWIPKSWKEEKDKDDPIELRDVYIVWEHTNFAAKNARNYNLSSLNDKVSYIEKSYPEYGGLILLQKSHALVPGDPIWSVEEFYNLLLSPGRR